MIFELIPIALIALAGVALNWVLTYAELRQASGFKWPQAMTLGSMLAATLQVPLPFVMIVGYTAQRNEKFVDWCAVLGVVLFVLAMWCVVRRRGLARWWLLFSAVACLVFAGLVDLVTGITF